MQTYIVQRGDTLYGISKQFGVPVATIKKVNNLNDNNIRVNQELKIPIPQETTIYIVKAGDTLYKIANKYNTTVAELVELNNLPNFNLSINQELKVPVQNNGADENDNYVLYTVKKGDNLYSIANEYGVSVEAIKKENNLTSNLLSVGQILKIPTENTSSDYQEYEVKAGDSLYTIAQKYGVTVEELMTFNNLNNTILSVGQILKIPQKDEIITPIKECYGTGYEEPQYETYTVKKGDNLYEIARRYNTSVIDLMNLNNLSSTTLQIGQILKVRKL